MEWATACKRTARRGRAQSSPTETRSSSTSIRRQREAFLAAGDPVISADANVGIGHDTAPFAVESIRRWWNKLGRQHYPQAKRLLISADGGGSNGSRVRLWKWELQQLADETGPAIMVCHLPPGTSKWNNTPHRLFAWISHNWRGKPRSSYAVILKLIAATTAEAGLSVPSQP